MKTWSSIIKYKTLSQFFGQDLVSHLSESDIVRNILCIGPKPVKQIFDLPSNVQYKLTCAAKKKSITKENRLHGKSPKFDCV